MVSSDAKRQSSKSSAPGRHKYENGFGERLRMIRDGAGYTQGDLAKLTGLPASSVSHFESGDRMPSADNLRRVAIALNVSADVLLDITPAGNREPQPFERYPALASWIERLANLPLQGFSLGDWCVFVGALNSALLRAELKSLHDGGPSPSSPVVGAPLEHANDCQSHIVDVRGRPDDCTCGLTASVDPDRLSPLELEAGCRAMHEEQGSGEADDPLHAPYQNSWEEPSLIRWQQWMETVEAVHRAIAKAVKP